MIKVLFIVGVVVTVPIFFIFTWLMSAYHRLTVLRKNCETKAGAPEKAKAVAEYNQARRSFPGNVIAALFGFKAAKELDQG